jgi:putative ABC transport system permease protein
LKIITLAVAFACSIIILLFSINEFAYDRFHQNYDSVFRILQKNNRESFNGNRLSNKIPLDVFNSLGSFSSDSLIVSRMKMMDKVGVLVEERVFSETKCHVADPEISSIFSFKILDGSLKRFNEKGGSVMLSSSAALKYFGVHEVAGMQLKMFTYGDTLLLRVAAVFEDYPSNSHEEFNTIVRFDSLAVQSLNFNADETGIYGRFIQGNRPYYDSITNKMHGSNDLLYWLQPLSEIYFGPRVLGEDAQHGDHYSIVILICITVLILLLGLSNLMNLTTLTLPYRAKELAIKKLAGTNQVNLTIAFVRESIFVVGISLLLGLFIMASAAPWIKSILSIDLVSLLLKGDAMLFLSVTGIYLVTAMAPILLTLRFTRASPTRLLSTETISFPQFKKTIMVLQFGISIFLIVGSMVIRRQVNYSLLKEPGRNHDQVVYLSYPEDLTNEGLLNMRDTWKKIHPNIIDVMATSQLPNMVGSKELNSPFYFMSVDPGFLEFFALEMIQGNWFRINSGDSIFVVNESGKKALNGSTSNVVGVFKDVSGQFNQPEKPLKINIAPYYNYNFLCIRILEVDIRRTVNFLERHFEKAGQKTEVRFLNPRFEQWLRYQDKLNTLSELLAIITGILSCCAIYGLSISIVQDKLKQIAIHKLCGANFFSITRILVKEFARQLLMAVLIFGPTAYLILKEILRAFVYRTPFNWSDPLIPLAYCVVMITLLCVIQTLGLDRKDLSSALK